MEALILVATHNGPTMFARIGVMRALNRHVERVFDPTRKEHHWGAPQASGGPMTVFIYVNPEGVAFEYEVPERIAWFLASRTIRWINKLVAAGSAGNWLDSASY
jgi:hypothetical protein